MNNTFQRLQSAKRFRWVGFVAVFVLGVGTVFYHFVEKLTWLNAIYFSTITLTTVGYGDITPQTEIGKLFTIFYVLLGVGIIATTLNILVKGAATHRIEKIHSRRSKTKNNKP